MDVHVVPLDSIWRKVHGVIAAFTLQEATFVTYISEGVVEVLASVACPVSWSYLPFEFVSDLLLLFGLFLGSFENSSFIIIHVHMLWLSVDVIFIFLFLTSIAVLSTFKVVVGAVAAFPPTIWEVKGT